MSINAGQPAPEFSLADETGTLRRLADYRGQTIVLYFYPKDDTPGCTTEACNFRDDYSVYEKNGVTILGVSPDNPASHAGSSKNSSCLSRCWPTPIMPCARLMEYGAKSNSWAARIWAHCAPPL